MLPSYSFILVTEELKNKNLYNYKQFLVSCAQHGITAIQVRDKSLEHNQIYKDWLIDLQKSLLPLNVALHINDYYQLAQEIDCKYIHVGQDDGSIQDIYNTIVTAYIGLSVNSLSELQLANQEKLYYVSAGSIFPTNSKKDVKNILGLNKLKEFKKLSKHPLVAIGGISIDNIDSVLQTGVNGVAIIQAIHQANNPIEIIQAIKKKILQANHDK